MTPPPTPAGPPGSASPPGTTPPPVPTGHATAAAVVQQCLQHPATAPGCPTTPTVYLTVDDGPNAFSTPQYLAVLRRYGVHATFFVMGRQVDRTDPALLRQVVADGNGIGLHSWSHDYHQLFPGRRANPAHISTDATEALASVRRALGPDFRTGAYRYPGGHMSWQNMAPADEALHRMGLSWIDWNSMFGDAEPADRRPTTAAGMVKLATDLAQSCHNNTVVVLLHDGLGAQTGIDAMPQVIEWFAAHGYQFGTIG